MQIWNCGMLCVVTFERKYYVSVSLLRVGYCTNAERKSEVTDVQGAQSQKSSSNKAIVHRLASNLDF